MALESSTYQNASKGPFKEPFFKKLSHIKIMNNFVKLIILIAYINIFYKAPYPWKV
jgi:hypothetical protein